VNRFLRPETLFFLLVWVGTLFAFRERGFWDPGSLWHIVVGQMTLDRGIPQTDPFSYTFEGRPWVPQQWGSEVLMAVAHNLGGFDLMLLAFATGVAALFTLIFRRCVLAPTREVPGTEYGGGMGPVLAALVVGGGIFVGAFHYYVRPHMFTIALLGWTMICAIDYERGWCSVRRLAWLVPLYVVWTNLHGGVLGGTMTLGLCVAGWGVLFLASGGRESPGEPRTNPNRGTHVPRSPITSWPVAFALVGIVIACLLTPLVNPHGLRMLEIWQRLLASKVMPQVISEHKPMDPTSQTGIMIVGLAAVYVVLLLSTLPKWPRVTWLVPLVWLVLTFKSIRQGPLFAITAAVCIADIWRFTAMHRYLVKNGDGSLAWNPEDDPARVALIRGGTRWWVIPAAVVALAAALDVARVPVPVIGSGWVQMDVNEVPVDLNPTVQALPPGTRVFNDLDLGGYLIYYAPGLKIYMDDRCELYGDDMLKEYVDAIKSPPEEFGAKLEAWRDTWGFDYVVITANPPDDTKPDNGKSRREQYLLAHPERWREIGRGSRAVVFERVRR
jgi:hypothetical protein